VSGARPAGMCPPARVATPCDPEGSPLALGAAGSDTCGPALVDGPLPPQHVPALLQQLLCDMARASRVRLLTVRQVGGPPPAATGRPCSAAALGAARPRLGLQLTARAASTSGRRHHAHAQPARACLRAAGPHRAAAAGPGAGGGAGSARRAARHRCGDAGAAAAGGQVGRGPVWCCCGWVWCCCRWIRGQGGGAAAGGQGQGGGGGLLLQVGRGRGGGAAACAPATSGLRQPAAANCAPTGPHPCSG
jgi:hypothetical protein